MDKKILSIIVIVTTVLSAAAMTKFSEFKNVQDNNVNKLNIINKIEEPKENKSNIVYKYINIYKLKSYKKNKEYKLDLLHNDKLNVENSYYTYKMNKEGNGINGQSENKQVVQQKHKNSSSEYPQNKIETKLTLEDKEKILYVAKVLAPVDYARIEEYIKMSNQEEGVRKALNLLKDRLSDKDYRKVEDVKEKLLTS